MMLTYGISIFSCPEMHHIYLLLRVNPPSFCRPFSPLTGARWAVFLPVLEANADLKKHTFTQRRMEVPSFWLAG